MGLSTRRQLLKGGALALGAAGLAGGARLVWPRGASATSVRRCVSLGANGVINPGSTQDYRSCRHFLLDTGTKWVRIWADWPSLQPEADRAPDRGSGGWRLRALDDQIAQARSDGIGVIITAYRFPTWANGTEQLTDELYAPEDRMPPYGNIALRKDLRFKLPADVGLGSEWARWIEFLIERYGESIVALEPVNEPNAQVWPLYSPTGELTIHRVVAQMFQTAQTIAAAHQPAPLLLGPTTSDTISRSRLAVPFHTFTRELLDELDRIGFQPGRRFGWAHHNYSDVEHDHGHGVAKVRDLLHGRWAGWPNADASNPAILIPEGGARLTKIASLYPTANPEELQARLIERNWNRMSNQPGVAMLGQYLFYSDPTFDCGLCDTDGTKRPAYRAWAGLPSA
jgi:hypothetical protein